MKNWRLWAALGAAILIAAAGIAAAYVWWLADPISPARDAALVTVEQGRLVEVVKAFGVVASPSRTTLTFGSGGRVLEVSVREGDTVQTGDELARLDTTELEMQVARAEATLALSQAQLARVQVQATEAEIEAARTALAAAQAHYEKVQAGPLAAEIASGEAALASAEASYKELQGGPSEEERAVLRANVERAQVALTLAQQAYDRIAWRPGAGATPQGQALQKATIDYEQALASYNLATAGPTPDRLQSAQAQIAQARAQLERVKTVGANDELKSAAAQVARAQAELDQLERGPRAEEVAVAQAQVDGARLALEQARRQLDEAVLVAPAAGTVVAVSANVGQSVAATSPIVTLVDLTELQVEAYVHESYVGHLRLGQPVLIALDAIPDQTFEGKVQEIAPLATNLGGMITYKVVMELAAGDVPIKPGMVAQSTIVISEKPDALLVPKGALQIRGGHWTVRAWRDGRLRETEVALGARDERMVEVLDGLAPGDQVALNTVPIVAR